ncbi:nitroreductase family protein [Streptomyces sp. NPDC058326]|uniref:nitroreductase family protein n=1 Tax=Streptomyces sp. NPDC058326 TaxID=3346447 RepID=UPI0036E884F8
MDVMTAVLTRRSRHVLREPAPGDAEFAYLLGGAAAAPDHGNIRPWRWILLRGEDREALGASLASEVPPEQRDRVAGKTLRAPLMAALVFRPAVGHKVPEWEQMAAASSVAYGLMLLLHARGYGSIWRTGRLCESPAAYELLGLAPEERLLGSLDIGTPGGPEAPARRRIGDLADHVTTFTSRHAPAGV